ncbi:MAG TPA: phage antirepressor [Porphyromonadaceae bacterium]|nr:phage antirepressor [Porphyromonadaceae bacterium]
MSTNKLIPFDYHGQPVRSLLIDNEPWFVAKDVCKILEIANTTDAVSRLDSDEVTRFNLGGLSGETNIVSESGLYSLTLGSKKPQAKPFKRWVTHEVIPAIRKTGSYSAHPMTQIEMLAAQAQQMVELEKKTNIAIESANSAQKQLNNAVDALAAPAPVNWQQATGDKIKHICKVNGLSYLKEYDKLYRELEHNAHVDLQSRVSRLKGRMKKAGYTFKECGKVTQLHVISRDPALKLAFDGIVRRFAAKYANTEVKND